MDSLKEAEELLSVTSSLLSPVPEALGDQRFSAVTSAGSLDDVMGRLNCLRSYVQPMRALVDITAQHDDADDRSSSSSTSSTSSSTAKLDGYGRRKEYSAILSNVAKACARLVISDNDEAGANIRYGEKVPCLHTAFM